MEHNRCARLGIVGEGPLRRVLGCLNESARLVTDFQAVGSVLLYLSLLPSIASAVDYVRAFYTLDTGEQRG